MKVKLVRPKSQSTVTDAIISTMEKADEYVECIIVAVDKEGGIYVHQTAGGTITEDIGLLTVAAQMLMQSEDGEDE